MGLDIYFEKRKRNDERYEKYTKVIEQLEEFNKLNEEEFNEVKEEYKELDKQREELNPRTEVAYFRKYNFLMEFFDYEGNCDYNEISKGQIEKLLECCEMVLGNHLIAEETLPTQGGFFFGSTNYDDNYFNCVKNVQEKFKVILEETDWENEILEMYAWW